MNVLQKINNFITKDYKSSTLNAGFMINPYNFAGGAVGGWKELGRTTLGSANTSITVSSLPDKRYYMLLAHSVGYGSAVSNFGHRFNGDSGSNYSSRQSNNNGSDSSFTSSAHIQQDKSAVGDSGAFNVGYIANYTTKEKLVQLHTTEFGGTGASVTPVSRKEIVGKWANTSNSISSYTWTNYQGTDTFPSGSEVVVLGWDPADTHTTNFWEELSSTNGSGGATISSGTITAKKYLMFSLFANAGASGAPSLYFNSDNSGTSYARRRSYNGSEFDQGSNPVLYTYTTTSALPKFLHGFIINNSANEKLVMLWSNESIGSGAGSVPDRMEFTGKWSNTSSQITSLTFDGGTSGYFGTPSILKVWGAS